MNSKDGDIVLLRSIVALYNAVKKLEEDTMKMEKTVFDAFESSNPLALSVLRSPLILKSPRSNFLRGALSTTSPTRSNNSVGRKKTIAPLVRRWNTVERSFQSFEAPGVQNFDLEEATIQGPGFASHRRSGVTSIVVAASPTQNVTMQKLFSPSPPETIRAGWDAPSTLQHTKMKQTSFSAPRDLKDMTLTVASRDALSDFGTTPGKVSEALETTKRGMPSNPTPPRTPAKLGASPEQADTAQKPKSSSTFPPMPSKAPTRFGGSNEAGLPAPASNLSTKDITSSINSRPTFQKVEGASTNKKLLSADTNERASSFPAMDALGSSLALPGTKDGNISDSKLFESTTTPSSGAGKVISSTFGSGKDISSSDPDYNTILTEFYKNNDPKRVSRVPELLEKYKVSQLLNSPIFRLYFVIQ